MSVSGTLEPDGGEFDADLPQESIGDLLELRAPGPVAAAFAYTATRGLDHGQGGDADLYVLQGPVGSGKTTICIRNMITLAMREHKSPVDGVRRCKWAVVANTYVNLERNFLASWFRYFPKEDGYSDPAQFEWTPAIGFRASRVAPDGRQEAPAFSGNVKR